MLEIYRKNENTIVGSAFSTAFIPDRLRICTNWRGYETSLIREN